MCSIPSWKKKKFTLEPRNEYTKWNKETWITFYQHGNKIRINRQDNKGQKFEQAARYN